MTDENHICCEEDARVSISSPEAPYDYKGSGLPNVALIGVRVYNCLTCHSCFADIPAMKSLHEAIARVLVQKQSRLNGTEVRFLRKRLNRRSIDFAQMIGITPQALSNIEASDARQLAEGRDKLVRIIYSVLSGDKKLKQAVSEEEEFEKWIMSLELRGERESISATWNGNHRWSVETKPMLLVA
jgi:DNA-binding transcriptional regulator YiaG